MSFLTTRPDELFAAAGKLETIGAAMFAQNSAAAAPTTTAVLPAAADEVSALQASLFIAYGTLYQQVSADAAAMYESFVNTLGVNAGTYEAAEAANSSAAASPFSSVSSLLSDGASELPPWAKNLANIVNIGVGNWASAASDLVGLAGGGLLPATQEAEVLGAAEGLEGASLAPAAAVAEGIAETPIAAGLGIASSIGALSAPPAWAAPATLVASTSSGGLQGAGWTTAATHAAPITAVPGMPGLASAGRNTAGFGAPRYGVKPIVMPKPVSV